MRGRQFIIVAIAASFLAVPSIATAQTFLQRGKAIIDCIAHPMACLGSGGGGAGGTIQGARKCRLGAEVSGSTYSASCYTPGKGTMRPVRGPLVPGGTRGIEPVETTP